MDEFTPTHEATRPIHAHPGIAWGFIIFFVLAAVVLMRLPEREPRPAAADGGVMMVVQGKIFAGGAALGGERGGRMYVRHADELNTGAIGQRQRAIVLIAELGGPEIAADRVEELDELLDEHARPDADDPVELTGEQWRVQELLRVLYLPEVPGVAPDVARPRVELLDQADRDLLIAELGWYGELALVPRKGPDVQGRRALLRGPMYAAIYATVLIMGLILLGLAGAVGLIVLIVFAAGGRLGRGRSPGAAPHGIYAETFAVWMAVFFGLNAVGGVLGNRLPDHRLLIMFVVSFASLIALLWPVIRGVPWRAVQGDIGLSLGRRPVIEGGIGAGGYVMGLPIFAVGIAVAVVFLFIHAMFAQALGEPGQPLDPEGFPAHPVFDFIVGPDLWPKIQLLLAAVIAAPIVEEIMFRGVLYRHLRDCFRSPAIGAALPILGSAAVTGFIFAVIHPVPWFAWPALMALAIAFALAREWRGTVFPSILMHAIHNAILTVTIVLILEA